MAVAVALLAVGALACGTNRVAPSKTRDAPEQTPAPSLRATPSANVDRSPTVLATVPVNVTATMTERCGYIGGCAAYLIVRPDGEPDWSPIPLLRNDPPAPIMLPLGSYTFHFSWRGVSDAVARGHPPAESILDTCSVDLLATDFGVEGTSFDVTAEFHGSTCDVSATASATIIN